MRAVLAIILFLTFLSAGAQSHLPVPGWGAGYMPWQSMPLFSAPSGNAKWQLKPSAGLSAGYVFFGRGISYVSAPLALTLYHPLTTNVTAFAGVAAAPTAFSVTNFYNPTPLNQRFTGNPLSPAGYGLGINAGIQGGLIYTNDAHTFSISGSFYMERGATPIYPSSRRTDDSKR